METPVVLITGALTGIGAAAAVAYAQEHAKVVISGRHPDRGIALAKTLQSAGAEAEFIQADVRYEKEVQQLVDRAVARFGQLDIAINNAGRETTRALNDETAETFAEIFDTNVLGTLLSLKHEFRVMKAQGKGSIVNISSLYGHRGFGLGGITYVASKHAIEGMTKSAALEGAASGIRVNAIAPGTIETAMFNRVIGGKDEVKRLLEAQDPQRRVGTAQEVAEAIKFIASDKAPYITGEILTIDGGVGAG
jgi:NAD(P)-dependent dehydrogenase (short-subunit alcohol dehydrogenase family)